MRRSWMAAGAIFFLLVGVIVGMQFGHSPSRISVLEDKARSHTLTLHDIELAAAQTTMFLQLSAVTGPANPTDHTDHAKVTKFGWGVSDHVAFQSGGTSLDKPVWEETTITRVPDKYSPVLAKRISMGQNFATAILYLVGTSTTPTIILKFNSVFITHYGVIGAGATATEQLRIDARSFQYIVNGIDSGPINRAF